MISLARFYGRIGNQLFQYAFVRATAARLGTTFYCPPWEGDSIFDLADAGERASEPRGITRVFDADPEPGFTPAALDVVDGTEVRGFFQSERFSPDKSLVRSWYTFKPEVVAAASEKYPLDAVHEAVSLSLRIDHDYAGTREYFPLYPLSYYQKGLEAAEAGRPVLVFADRPDLAKNFFRKLKGHDLRYVEALGGAEQLFLMSQCRANVITNSTFAWWGAWLNRREGHRIVAPSVWIRSGVPHGVSDILCDEWIKVPGTLPVWDHFQAWRLRHPVATVKRITNRLFSR